MCSLSHQAKILGLNAMKLLGLDVSKYWTQHEEEESLPEAKRFKADNSAEVASMEEIV